MEHAMQRTQERTRMMVQTGAFAALACVATMVVKVPSPTNGYMNLGDTVVLLGAYLLGPVYGAVAAGIGSALADILLAAAVYAPATLVIKALMALVAGTLYRHLRRTEGPGAFHALGVLVTCGLVGEVPMVLGYWLYDALLLGSLAGSAIGIPSNLVQAAFGVTASTLLALALRKSGYVRKRFPTL